MIEKIFNLVCIIFIAITGSSCSGISAPYYDLVIDGGRVIDPETQLDDIRYVGVVDGKIEIISSEPILGREHIDARGLVVSPGFIDLHAHGQNYAGQTYQVHDGVTTALELESGVSPFPNKDGRRRSLREQLRERSGKSLIHYGYSAGYYGAREIVKERDIERIKYEAATPEEMTAIFSMVERDLDAGALGVGLPLDYISKGVDETELEGIFTLSAERKVPLFVHIRVPDDERDLSGFEELVALVRKTGASLHMVHITSTGMGRVDRFIEIIEQARADGFDVSTEVYPYTAASTEIGAQVFDGNWNRRWGASYKDVEWPPTGKRFTSKEMWNEYRNKFPDSVIILHYMKEAWVESAIRHPDIMIVSDGMIETMNQRTHPRIAGSYSRVLGRYVREKKVISLVDAIRKMSYLPAKRLENFTPAMRRKGRLQKGADADITIFDPDTVIDMATFSNPNQFSDGILHVIVAGQWLVKGGSILPGIFPGMPITTKDTNQIM